MADWEAYNQVELIGAYRRDYHIAELTSLVYNFLGSMGSKNGRRKISTPQDFTHFSGVEKIKKVEKTQSVEDMKQVLYQMAGKSYE